MEDVQTEHTEETTEQPPEVDTQDTTKGVEAQDADSADTEAVDESTETEDQTTEVPKPFENGTEKLVVNGKEIDADWNTVKKYAQIGYLGLEATKRAKSVEKQATETYKQILKLATDNPAGLIEVLTGKKWNGEGASNPKGAATEEHTQAHDPRDQRIAQLEQKIEQREIEQERVAFQKEFDDALKAYPHLDDEFVQEYLKGQYKSALESGLNVTVDDIAFTVSQRVAAKKSEQAKARQKSLAVKKKTTPVSARVATPKVKSDEGYELEEVLKLAGRA